MGWIAPQLTGGLGNRLFQFSAAKGLAEKWGYTTQFVISKCTPTNHGPFDTIFKLFPTVPVLKESDTCEVLSEPYLGYYKYYSFPLIPSHTGNYSVSGYRQTEKYFPTTGIHPDFENALGPETVAALKRKITNPSVTWFIHVRLGDYKILAHHQVNLKSYYTKCIQEVPKDSLLILFSDETDLCKEMIHTLANDNGLQFVVCESSDELSSLYLMSCCKGGAITANSTFSWWGAYLAHQNAPASFRAFYPSSWGQHMPQPVDITPSWGTMVSI